MEQSKLKTIIEDKNRRLEREALYTAESIIEQISTAQTQINNLQDRIAELRQQLVALQVEQLDPNIIFGGE